MVGKPNGEGGGSFDSGINPSGVKKIIIRSGKYVDAIQLEFKNGESTKQYGGNGGGRHELNVDIDNTSINIEKIKIHSGNIVDSIQFVFSNNQASKKYGGDRGGLRESKPRKGQILVGIKGRCGKFVDKLIPIWRSVHILQNRSDWLSRIPNEVNVSKLSIPGTHESMTLDGIIDHNTITNRFVNSFVYCQYHDNNLQWQLENGIRAIDIRCAVDTDGSDFYVHHGGHDLASTFTNVLDICIQFLRCYPSEFIFLFLKYEGPSRASDISFQDIFKRLWVDPRYKDYWYQGSNCPSLGEVRSHIILLRRFSRFERGFDLTDWNDNDVTDRIVNKSYYIQDLYSPGVRKYDSKTDRIKETFTKSNAFFENEKAILFINFISATSSNLNEAAAIIAKSAGIAIGKCIGGAIVDTFCLGQTHKRTDWTDEELQSNCVTPKHFSERMLGTIDEIANSQNGYGVGIIMMDFVTDYEIVQTIECNNGIFKV
mmetsp:Transcript_16666/g.15031  ORF Transcript_16666/g.15031 Transcript_16666/m.15031 type:complete len:484 (+) Transcript_16666:54-1505(+)